jgi:hypothetical protein
MKEIKFSRPFLMSMLNWDYGQEHILEMKMEEVTAQPHQQFRRVLRHLDLLADKDSLLARAGQRANRLLYAIHHRIPGETFPSSVNVERALAPGILDRIVDAHSFDKLTGGRVKGESNPESHYRKGEPGDWRNHFTPQIADAFRDAYGDLVARLGYEGWN